MPYYYPIDYRPEYVPKAESYIQFASVYRDSLKKLLRSFDEQAPIHDYSLAPAVMLLIHYIELTLKGTLHHCKIGSHEPLGTHNLSYLYKKAHEEVEYRFGSPGKSNPDVDKFIMFLGNFDNKSQAFRYPETKLGEDIGFAEMNDWLYDRLCTLPKFTEISEKIIADLDGLAAYVSIQLENEQETMRYADMNR